VGFRVLARLAERWELKPGKDRFKARLAQGRPPAFVLPPGSERPQVALLCPQTF
jgi:hypothetical protein